MTTSTWPQFASRWVVDLDDPRAPPSDVWQAMTATERQSVLRSLPSEFPDFAPNEGDFHRIPKEEIRDQLSTYFRRRRRNIYLSSEISIYYPNEPRFAPDVIAVLDVDPHPRNHWVVDEENRGLDFVLEVHAHGSAPKDYEVNVERYARLGISEYFIFEPALPGRAPALTAYRLTGSSRQYEQKSPIDDRHYSAVLDLDLAIDLDGRLRFYTGNVALPLSAETLTRLDAAVRAATVRSHADHARAVAAEERAAATVRLMRETLISLLEEKFRGVPEELRSALTLLSAEELLALMQRAAVAVTLDELKLSQGTGTASKT